MNSPPSAVLLKVGHSIEMSFMKILELMKN
nr:MAG TPA: hypothetical protein [Caudoviricetes sp.]